MFECLELTRAFAETQLCDCGIGWRLIVLGGERLRAGARAFRWRGGGGWGAMLVGLVCDVVVMPCDVHRSEMARPRIGSLLLMFLVPLG